jgi:hypothetical protein
MMVGPDLGELVKLLIPIPLMLLLGVIGIVALRSTRKSGFLILRRQRLTALLHRMFFVAMLLSISAYLLRIAVEFTTRYTELPSLAATGQIILYGVSVLLGILWAPSSLPRSVTDDATSAERGARWIPWVVGIQSAMVGLGVFLGAWFMHDEVTWGGLLLVGLSTLTAMLIVTGSILGFYRFLILALNEIPPQLREELKLRS